MAIRHISRAPITRTEVDHMVANALLVMLGALSIAGLGIGAATVSNAPLMGMQNGACPAQGGGGMMGYGSGQCAPNDHPCDREGDLGDTCDQDQDETCDMPGGEAGCFGGDGPDDRGEHCH